MYHSSHKLCPVNYESTNHDQILHPDTLNNVTFACFFGTTLPPTPQGIAAQQCFGKVHLLRCFGQCPACFRSRTYKVACWRVGGRAMSWKYAQITFYRNVYFSLGSLHKSSALIEDSADSKILGLPGDSFVYRETHQLYINIGNNSFVSRIIDVIDDTTMSFLFVCPHSDMITHAWKHAGSTSLSLT